MLREGEAEEPHHRLPADGEDDPPGLTLKTDQGLHEAPVLAPRGDRGGQAKELVPALDRRHESLQDRERTAHAQGLPQERVENILGHGEDLV